MKQDRLLSLLQENHGYLKTSDVVDIGVSRAYLAEFVQKHQLTRVARGLYMSEDAWDDGLFILSTRYKNAVYSHETALYLLELAEREPLQTTLTLASGSNTSELSKENVKVYKVKPELLEVGLTQVRGNSGHFVRSYNKERTIVDLFRSRKNVEAQDLQSAVRTYLQQKDRNLPLLMRYAKLFSVENIIRNYMGVLL